MTKFCTHCHKTLPKAHQHVSPNKETPCGDFCLAKDGESISCFEMHCMEFEAKKGSGLSTGGERGGTVRPSATVEAVAAHGRGARRKRGAEGVR